MGDEQLVVTRWRRWGKDRLYVETWDGTKVGFWDLADDTGHAEGPELEPRLVEAVARWRESQPAEPADADDRAEQLLPEPALHEPDLSAGHAHDDDVPDESEPLPDADQRPWIDLASNSAGAEARQRAQSARSAAPVRTALARVLGVHTDERAWRIGADGEERVAAELAKVRMKDPRWRFLHAVPVGGRGSDIDHVVVGPGGVFTVNAKHHPGAAIWVGGNTFMVNGSRQPYVRNARHEAERASRVLSEACGFTVHVQGLVVTVNAKSVTVKSQPDGVAVVPRMQLASWLRRHGDLHTDEIVERVYEVARRSTTWQ
ncbi:nuclease-related domain-containing protein [Knoellia sp. CPCC 206450]|uniref:nuclease-related domain-containing protein n=1 Tax=Knoellia tibetensis TaxID=3404798 RepID=UPI003B436EB5